MRYEFVISVLLSGAEFAETELIDAPGFFALPKLIGSELACENKRMSRCEMLQ